MKTPLSNQGLFRDKVPGYGLNLPESAIKPHIEDAESELSKVINASLFAALKNAAEELTTITPEVSGAVYVNGSKKLIDNEVYQFNGTSWVKLELFEALKIVMLYVTYKAAARFYIFHGINVNQFGLNANAGGEFTGVSDKARAMASNDMERLAVDKMADLQKYLYLKNNTLDGVTYGEAKAKSSPSFGITAINKRWP